MTESLLMEVESSIRTDPPNPEAYSLYYKNYFPLTLLQRLVTCNRPETTSPQCRYLRLEIKPASTLRNSSPEAYANNDFCRINAPYLAYQLQRLKPESIHLGFFLPLKLQKESFSPYLTPDVLVDRAARKRRITGATAIEPITTPILRESREEYIHFAIPLKELVFDMDIPDFDRFCDCSNKLLCSTCWLHMEGAYFILEHWLLQELGYARENLLFVFSGGKGLHCLINAPRAMALDNVQRTWIYDHFYVGNGRGENGIADDLRLFEWVARSAGDSLSSRVEALFYEMVVVQRALLCDLRFQKWLVAKLGCHYAPSLIALLESQWQRYREKKPDATNQECSVAYWGIVKKMEAYVHREESNIRTLVPISRFIVYRLYYPILDKGPMMLGNTSKCPFSIHKSTRQLALPIEQSFIECLDKAKRTVTVDALVGGCAEALSQFQNGQALMQEWLSRYRVD